MPDLKVLKPKAAPAIERLVDDYLAHCQAIGLSAKTVKFSYGYPLRQVFLPWCAEQGIAEVGALTSRDVDRLSIQLMEQGGKRGALSRGSVWTYLKAVKRFLAWGREEGEAVQAEAKLPKLPQRLVEVLSRAEIERLEDAALNERDKLIVRLLADSGIRVSELVQLGTSDFVERDRSAFIKVTGKGVRERLVPLTPALYRRLRRYADRGRPQDAGTDRVFLALRKDAGGDYRGLTPSGVQQMVRGLGEKAGLGKRVHPHIFRHSAATHYLQRGMDSLLVAQILGHSSLQMIQKVYSHLSPNDAHAALVAALRQDDDR
jgi:integrase/recombinase XerD